MWKSIVQTDRPQITMQYGAYALYAGYLREEYRHINTFSEYVVFSAFARQKS
jgi:hypothetical protein